MRLLLFHSLVCSVLLVACSEKRGGGVINSTPDLGSVSDGSALVDSVPFPNKDSLYNAFEEGEFFWDNVILLDDHGGAYFYLDTSFSENGHLRPEDAKEHYDRIRSMQTDEFLQAHKRIWSLAEMKDFGAENLGHTPGLHRVYTWMTVEPLDSIEYYQADIYRDYFNRQGVIWTFVNTVRYFPDSDEFWVSDASIDGGQWMPIGQWRLLKK